MEGCFTWLGCSICVVVLVGAVIYDLQRHRGGYDDSDPHLNGMTPAVITIPYSSFLIAGGSIKVAPICGEGRNEYVVHREGETSNRYSFNEPSNCSAARQVRVTSVSCTEDPWNVNRPAGHYFTCVEDPSRHTSFTIWQAKDP